LLGEPKKADKDCCKESKTNTRKKTSNCSICNETIHNQCRGTSGECKNGCKKVFIFRQQKKLDISQVPELVKSWPKWEMIPDPDKEEEKERIKKTLRKDKKVEPRLVKQTKKANTGTCEIFKDKGGPQQPKITETFRKLMEQEPREGEEYFDKTDSHGKEIVQAKKKTSRSKKRRQLKKMKEAEKKEGENVPLRAETEEDTDTSINSEDEDREEGDGERLYKVAEEVGIPVPKKWKDRLSQYRKDAEEWKKKAEDSMKKIEEMKMITPEKRLALQKESLHQSLLSCAGISKEMLDTSLNTRNQLEKHIFTVERENLILRGLLQENGMDPDEQLGKAETLFAHKSKNEDEGKMERFMELMMIATGFGDEKTLKDMKQYINNTTGKEGIEKHLKKFVIVNQERKKDEKEEEVITLEEETVEEEKDDRTKQRSVSPPLPELATKL